MPRSSRRPYKVGVSARCSGRDGREERFRLASVAADDRGLPGLRAATMRVATQIRSTREKAAAQKKFLPTYMKNHRSQAGLTRSPSINVVTTLR